MSKIALSFLIRMQDPRQWTKQRIDNGWILNSHAKWLRLGRKGGYARRWNRRLSILEENSMNEIDGSRFWMEIQSTFPQRRQIVAFSNCSNACKGIQVSLYGAFNRGTRMVLREKRSNGSRIIHDTLDMLYCVSSIIYHWVLGQEKEDDRRQSVRHQ